MVMAVVSFRGPRSVAQAAVRANGIVVPPPGLDQHLGLGEAVEDHLIEQFIAKRPIEALVVVILPWRARRRDIEGRHAGLGKPCLHGGGYKFGAIVGPDRCRRAPALNRSARAASAYSCLSYRATTNERHCLLTDQLVERQT